MRKVFIDAGANVGQSARAFIKQWPQAHEYKIYCFEASSGQNIRDSLKKLKHEFNNVEVLDKAVWITDGKVKFYDEGGTSSSLIQEKLPFVKPRQVDSIDLSSWVLNNFSENCKIILKLDIEGAEYEVLEKMVMDGSVFLVDEILIEIHGSKCGKTLEESIDMLNLLRSVGHKLYQWDAETFDYNNYKKKFYTPESLTMDHFRWHQRGCYHVVAHRKENQRKQNNH